MTLITLEEAKTYLRVDSADEDAIIDSLLSVSENLCVDVARLSPEQWKRIGSMDDAESSGIRETMKVAILYALGYLYEHREEADHRELALSLRGLLFSIREGVF